MERFSIEKGYHVAWGKEGLLLSVSGLAGEFAEAEKAMNRRLYYQGSEGSEQSTNFANWKVCIIAASFPDLLNA